MSTQGVKLDDQTAKELKALAVQKGHSPHWLMKTAIEQYVARESAYEREKQADQERWDAYATTGTAYQNTDVIAWLADLATGSRSSWYK